MEVIYGGKQQELNQQLWREIGKEQGWHFRKDYGTKRGSKDIDVNLTGTE